MLGHIAPQAAIGVVGNPSLCPAFRVRRGRGRENGFAASRARRATRPTPSEFRHPPGDGADFSLPASVLGHRSPPASPCALPRSPRSSLGTRSESGGDADRTDRYGRGAQGTTESSADARDPMTRRTKRAIASNQCRRQPAARSWAIERSKSKLTTTPSSPFGGGAAPPGLPSFSPGLSRQRGAVKPVFGALRC